MCFSKKEGFRSSANAWARLAEKRKRLSRAHRAANACVSLMLARQDEATLRVAFLELASACREARAACEAQENLTSSSKINLL